MSCNSLTRYKTAHTCQTYPPKLLERERAYCFLEREEEEEEEEEITHCLPNLPL